MAVLVMVYGHSGSGKSASLRNFDPEQVAVINVLGKPLPFRSNMKTYITNDYGKIDAAIHSTKRKSIVIDDATYLMTGEFMRNAKVAGYQKFTDMAANFNALLMRAKELPDDVVVYFFGHSERDGEGGEKFKTIGKLLATHIRTKIISDGKKETKVNPETYMRFLLEEPNPYMTGQKLQERNLFFL